MAGADACSLSVTVCDPRIKDCDGWLNDGITLIHAIPGDLMIKMKLDSRSAVVALTYDPKLAELALMKALRSGASYVGAMGSRFKNAKRRERLLQFDLDDVQINRAGCTNRSASISVATPHRKSPSLSLRK